MALINRHNLPPGGWMFDQKSNDGVVIRSSWLHRMSPFSDMVSEISKFRSANGLLNAEPENVAGEVDDFQCVRLAGNGEFCNQKKTTPLTRLIRQPVAAVVASVEAAARRIGELNEGRKILSGWLGEGGNPVAAELAQNRADVCTGRKTGVPCPFNEDGFAPVEAVAGIIKSQVEKKSDLKLAVEGGGRLKTCTQCMCHLPLKVHVPMNFILAHTKPETLDKIRRQKADCWQVTEKL